MARVIELLSCMSRAYNAVRGGGADLTYSARCHRDGLENEEWIDWVFEILTGEKNHCRRWWEEEVRRSRRNVQIADAELLYQQGFVGELRVVLPTKQ